MPVLVDPDQVLSDKKKRPAVSQIVSWLLYPVIFLVGVTVGIAIGVSQAPKIGAEQNANRTFTNAKIVTNVSNLNRGNQNGNVNAKTNTNSSLLNTNIFRAGDSSKIDAATEANLQAQKQEDLNKLDKNAEFIDILRQQDLVDLKYHLGAYHAVRGEYPNTDGIQVRLERNEQDVFYADMKDFYGGSYYEKVDPESPKYYYGYLSDGSSFTLSAFLTSRNKAFFLKSEEE